MNEGFSVDGLCSIDGKHTRAGQSVDCIYPSPTPVVNATGEAPPATDAQDVMSYQANLQTTLHEGK